MHILWNFSESKECNRFCPGSIPKGKSYTPQQNSDLYLASGDATDWLYGETRVPSFTIELRPTSASPGFQLPESEIQPTFEENLPAALFLIQWTQDLSRMSTL